MAKDRRAKSSAAIKPSSAEHCCPAKSVSLASLVIVSESRTGSTPIINLGQNTKQLGGLTIGCNLDTVSPLFENTRRHHLVETIILRQ